MLQNLVRLAFDIVAGTAATGSLRVTALNNETGFDPVERQAVVELFVDQFDEVRAGFWCFLGKQLDHDLPLRRLHRDNGVRHFGGATRRSGWNGLLGMRDSIKRQGECRRKRGQGSAKKVFHQSPIVNHP